VATKGNSMTASKPLGRSTKGEAKREQ